MTNFIEQPDSWLLLNLDKREYIVLGSRTPLYQWLSLPPPPPFAQAIFKSSVYPIAKYTAAQGTRTGILHLPTELLHTIVRDLSPSEAIRLALTSRLLCAIVGPQVAKLMAPWAGDRLVRVKGSVLLEDFETSSEDSRSEFDIKLETTAERAKTRQPVDMFTSLQRREILAYDSTAAGNTARCHRKRTVHAFVTARYYERPAVGGMPLDLINLPDCLAAEPTSKAARCDKDLYEQWCKTVLDASFDRLICTSNKDVPSTTFALRNLSTRRFVYEHDILRYREEKDIDWFDLDMGHIVLRHVLWRRGKGDRGEGEAVTTSWAGHRFEISPMTEGEEGWVNVSGEVIELLRHE
ncbi:hypothetical protein EIP86_005557 [Pleurotus ostreatoroseus]|nr:hypothetical protein EIP86_005557 [Pleurotus ostreatoroseus]